MSTKQIIIILPILILLFLIGDIAIHLFYCSGTALKFNSQEFNNIASPIVSLLGFIGVIVTILLTLKQIKHQQGTSYIDYYRDYIDKMANENPKDNFRFSTLELLEFPFYSMDKFELLKKDPQFLYDLGQFKNDKNVNSENKDYDKILGNVRLFAASLSILLKRYKSLIIEIDSHENLDISQKKLLLKYLFDSQVEKYYYGSWLVDDQADFVEIKSDFYFAFSQTSKDDLRFYNHKFYELKKLIDNRSDLKKLMEPVL